MMKKSGYTFKIPVPIYCCSILVSVAQSNETLKKELDEYGIEYGEYFDSYISIGRCTDFDNGEFLIRFRDYQSLNHSTISHECFHATTLILDRIGMRLNVEHNDEAYAYLLGWLVQEIWSGIK